MENNSRGPLRVKFRKPVWRRRYLTLDEYMSGGFLRLFLWACLLSLALFLVLYLIASLASGWSIGETFVQMSNPTKNWENGPEEWVPIVLVNLFGLAVLNGVVLTLLVNWISNRRENFDRGETRYEYIHSRKYSVVIGGHPMVATLARSLMNRGDIEYLIVMTRRDPQRVRRDIAAEISDEDKARRVVVYSGDRTSPHELAELHPEKACEVFVIGESMVIDGSNHDAMNMKCWELLREIGKSDGAGSVACHMMFEYQSTFAAFQFADILTKGSCFRFIPFSIYETWAQQVLAPEGVSGKNNGGYLPLDGKQGIGYDSKQGAQLIIIGMSKMGMALAIEAAHIAHYPNFNNEKAGRPRTRITLIDRRAGIEMDYFMGRYRSFASVVRSRFVKVESGGEGDKAEQGCEAGKLQQGCEAGRDCNIIESTAWNDPLTDSSLNSPYCGGYLGENLVDIEIEFIQADVASPVVQRYITDCCAKSAEYAESKVTIAVCMPNAAEAMSAALYFDSSVYHNALQILVQQNETGALVDALNEGSTGSLDSRYARLRPFGMLDKCEYLERINSVMPKLICYAYDKEEGIKPLPQDSEGKIKRAREDMKDAQGLWDNINNKKGKSIISQQMSNVYCVNSIQTKLRSIGYVRGTALSEKEIEQLALVEHNRWVVEQLLLGIRPVGREYASLLPIEDEALRDRLKGMGIHPDIVSNDVLGKSSAFDRAIVASLPTALDIYDIIKVYGMAAEAKAADAGPADGEASGDSASSDSSSEVSADAASATSADAASSSADAGNGYTPQPVDTSDIELPEQLVELAEEMAYNVHEVWSANRIRDGWSFGEVRDDATKKHPCLIRYEELPEQEKHYDRCTSQETLKFICKKGFRIVANHDRK